VSPRATQAGVPSKFTLIKFPLVPLKLLTRPCGRRTNPLRELVGCRRPVRIQVARDHRGDGILLAHRRQVGSQRVGLV
jgi:hypothetical protein